MADLVARLGSRATEPSEMRGPGGIEAYVPGLLAPPHEPDAPARRLGALVEAARARRRIDPERLTALLRALAQAPTAEVNHAALARATGVPATTLPPYLDLLGELDVVRLLPGARSGVARRAVQRPRAVWVDPSLATHLTGLGRAELLDLGGRRRLAPLLHGLVARRLLAESTTGYRLAHLRERNGLAIDLLVELPDETVIGIEVRTAGAYRPHQFARLEALRARVGSRLRLGIVLLGAPTGHRHDPQLWTLPLAVALDGATDGTDGTGRASAWWSSQP